MTFELDTKTKVRVLDVRTLAAKDRKPDEPPGAQLLLQAILPAETLNMFEGSLSNWLYRKAGGNKQTKLEGMEGLELTTLGEHVKRMPWVYEQTGCTVEIDRIGAPKHNIVLDDCKVHRVSFAPQQGGGVKTQWTVDAPGLSDAVRGKLTGLKSTEIEMQLALPEVAQEQIPGTGAATDLKPVKAWPFPGDGNGQNKPKKEAGEAFVDAHVAGKDQAAPGRRNRKATVGSVE